MTRTGQNVNTAEADNKQIRRVTDKLDELYESRNKRSKKPGILDTLIATKLSQNTTDKTSYKAYLNLKERFASWDDVAKAPLSSIKSAIRICGLADTKSKDIKKMLNDIIAEHGSLNMNFLIKKSDDEIYKVLLKYKGIGVKTVSCVLAFSMGRNVFPVDTHVHRVLNRLGITETNTPEQTFEAAKSLIPDEKKVAFHINLIKFGRNICKARNPLCGSCPVYNDCGFSEKSYFKEHQKDSTEIRSAIQENNFIILNSI